MGDVIEHYGGLEDAGQVLAVPAGERRLTANSGLSRLGGYG